MKKLKVKEGAASFYVVAFSTLILLIIAASFTALVIAQITRSSNADLSQSAYDSALAGVEDAKLAFYNYQSCLSKGASAKEPNDDGILDCDEIIYIMENTDGCDKVSFVLGRAPYSANSDAENGGEVVIEESSENGNNMSQAYTCTKIQTSLKDYRSTISSSNQMKVVKMKFDNNVKAKDIERVRISWGADLRQVQYNNFNSEGQVAFRGTNSLSPANPPTISVSLLQAAESFTMDQFDITVGSETNRGTVYLVPTGDVEVASPGEGERNYVASYDGTMNVIKKEAFLKSNDRTAQNLPYGVYCPEENAFSSEFVCSAMMELPDPIGGERGDDNFVMIIALPYGRPSTDFALEFFCKSDVANCGTTMENGEEVETKQANLRGVQIGVDSTGRANDMFRRVEARLEGDGDYSLSIMGPLELFGDGNNNNDTLLEKNYSVICEANFPDATYYGNRCSD